MLPRADPIHVWVVEDNALTRRSLAAVLDGGEGIACPLAVESVEEVLAALDAGDVPQIVLMDIGLPGMNGIEGAQQIRARSASTRVVMLTVHEEDEKVFDAICAGASGYLLKPASPERIVEAVRQVSDGAAPINGYIAGKLLGMFASMAVPSAEYGLTEREQEVLELMVEGLTMRQSAERLHVSYHTIDTHVRNIYGKLHVHSRGGAVAKALKERLVGDRELSGRSTRR